MSQRHTQEEQTQTNILILSFPVLSPIKPLGSEDKRSSIELSVAEDCGTLQAPALQCYKGTTTANCYPLHIFYTGFTLFLTGFASLFLNRQNTTLSHLTGVNCSTASILSADLRLIAKLQVNHDTGV